MVIKIAHIRGISQALAWRSEAIHSNSFTGPCNLILSAAHKNSAQVSKYCDRAVASNSTPPATGTRILMVKRREEKTIAYFGLNCPGFIRAVLGISFFFRQVLVLLSPKLRKILLACHD